MSLPQNCTAKQALRHSFYVGSVSDSVPASDSVSMPGFETIMTRIMQTARLPEWTFAATRLDVFTIKNMELSFYANRCLLEIAERMPFFQGFSFIDDSHLGVGERYMVAAFLAGLLQNPTYVDSIDFDTLPGLLWQALVQICEKDDKVGLISTYFELNLRLLTK